MVPPHDFRQMRLEVEQIGAIHPCEMRFTMLPGPFHSVSCVSVFLNGQKWQKREQSFN
jgi:hypothetical protein